MIFMEVERARLNFEMKDRGRELRQSLIALQSGQNWVDIKVQDKKSLNLFLAVGEVRNDMGSFKREVEKMAKHMEDFKAYTDGTPLEDAGNRMAQRLDEIVGEAEYWLRFGQSVLDGTQLKTQMVSSQTHGAGWNSNKGWSRSGTCWRGWRTKPPKRLL
jgi:predicted transport protein